MKEPKVKKVKSPEQIRKDFVIATLRRASYRWFSRSEALTRARISRGVYKCEMCLQPFPKKEVHLDHIHPIVPVTGFDTWDGYIERLFCNVDGFSVLCENCHYAKTSVETSQRKINRDKKKKLDNPV